MNSRLNLSALFLVGSLTVWLPTSDAFAATATISDVTDFITRLGGYLFPVDGLAPDTYYYWTQASYTVNPSGGGQNPSGGGQNPSGGGQNPSGGGSNVTKIVLTKLPKAAVLKASGSGAQQGTLTNTASVPNQLYPCAVEDYSIETVTLDLRDIRPSTPNPTTPESLVDEDGKAIQIIGEDGKPVGKQIWPVVLQTSSKASFIRQNIQRLPPNCPPAGKPGHASMTQKDVSQYSIYFADSTEANQFVQLLNNAIPTLNPPVLIPPPPK
jgi:hypothetical protein